MNDVEILEIVFLRWLS